MPEPLPITPALTLPAEDLAVEFARSSGPGGQHVNKTETRVRLRFALDRCTVLDEPTKARLRSSAPGLLTVGGEILMESDRFRSRERNLAEVRGRLVRAVRAALVAPRPRRPTRPSAASRRRRV